MNKKWMAMIGAMVMALGVMATGCGNQTSDSGENTVVSELSETGVSASVIVGVHSNAKIMNISTADMEEVLMSVSSSYGKIAMVRCDGAPAVIFEDTIDAPSVKNLSDSKLQQIAKDYTSDLQVVLAQAKAETEEVDTLEAIRLGANALHNVSDEDQKVLVILDSGLSTTGYLDFTDGILQASTDDILNALEQEQALPDLSGEKVLWFFCGETAAPQEPLSEAQKNKLKEIWRTVLEASGAETVEFSYEASSSEAYEGLPAVSVVDADERKIDVEPLEPMVLESSSVDFNGDLATFRNPDAAEAAIREVAEVLNAHPENTVYVVGCTATDLSREEFCDQLSKDRAQAVVDVLLDAGVSETQVTAVGVGFHAPWHKEDLDASGHQTSVSQENRCVWIVDKNDETYSRAIKTFL